MAWRGVPRTVVLALVFILCSIQGTVGDKPVAAQKAVKAEGSPRRHRDYELPRRLGEHVVWSYGSGNAGVADGELSGPHTAEENPFNPDEVLVAEQYGSDIIVVNRRTGTTRVLYGERGVTGGGERLNTTHSAHYMPTGPYRGHVVITEYNGDQRVLIIHGESGDVLWSHTGLRAPLDAIYWDDEHIMVSARDDGVFKVRLSDRKAVWNYDPKPRANPFYLQKLGEHFASYGGDLLIGYYGEHATIREVETASKKTVWTYGEWKGQGSGDLWDRLYTPVRAFRYGIQENAGGLTIIVDERARILCINHDKELVWELGGANANRRLVATPYIILPTYIAATRRGTLLVTDWGRNMIYEIDPFQIPVRMEKDAYLFRGYATTDQLVDSAVVESRGYEQKLVQIYNKHESNEVSVTILGSHNRNDWQPVSDPRAVSAGGGSHLLVEGPWNYIKARAMSATPGSPATVDVYIGMRR